MDYNRGSKSAQKASPLQERKMASDGLQIMGNLRDEQEEKQRLEKANFDLKMKVYYLEESLKRFQDGENMSDIQTDSHKIEISKLKLQLEDKQVDLEQRNLLLIKSKNAIEALKTEIERLRNENDHHHDLEDRIRRLKQLNEDIENDYRGQITQLEQQLSAARQLVDSKTIEKATSEDKMSHLELSFEQVDNHLKDTQQEKRRIQDQLTAALQKISVLEDDITQNRAHMDLYRIELQEIGEDRDALKEKYRQEQLSKLKAEEDAKVRFNDCTKHYENQIRAMRVNHEQDMEKIRQGHMEMLADVRENYQSELARTKAELERSLAEVRQADNVDLNRVKENFTIRIEEKNEEIKSLRNIMNGDSARVDSLLQELDTTRLALRDKSQLAEKLLIETTAKGEELKVIPRIMKDLDECRANLSALQAQVQREQHEKHQLSSQSDQLSSAVEALRTDLRQREQALQTAQNDNARLIRDVTDLTSKADSVEVVSRENERLKGNVARLETEGLSLNHKISELKRELERALEENNRSLHERQGLTDTLRTTQSKLEAALDQQEALHIQDQSERERRSAAEAALNETRAVLTQSREELQAERAAKLEAQKRAQSMEEDTREMRHSLGQACVMSYNAMEEWDETLSEVLDGDMFASISRGSARSPHHSSHRLSHHGGVSSSLLLNESNRSSELLTMSTEQLLQRVAVRIERVGLKLQRTEKIRALFVGQAEKLVDLMQQGMHNSQERITLYHHKLGESQGQLTKLQKMVQRDRKQRDDESQELTHFKEVVLSQHTAQIRDSEIRFAQATQQLEHERQRSEELQRQVASQSDELRSLQQINQRMHEDLEVLERTEKIVVDLSHRAGELGELNRSMSRDNEHKSEVIMSLTKENSEVKLELSSMVARAENLLSQLRNRDEVIEESEGKLQGLVREIERLRSRQIHPDLAKTIQDTQSILQSAVRGNNAAPASAPFTTRFTSSGSVGSDKFAEYLLQVDQLEQVAADLIRRTSEMVTGFETHMNSRTTRGTTAALTALKQEVYDLLDANSTLSVQMQQLVADFKKSIRQMNLVNNASAQDAPRLLSSTSAGSHGATTTTSDSSAGSLFPTRRALMTPSVSALERTTAGMNLDDLRVDHRSPQKFDAYGRSSPVKYEEFSEPQYTSSIRKTLNMSTTQRLGAHESRAPASPDAFSSTSQSARFHSTPTVASTQGLGTGSTYKPDEGRHLTFDTATVRTGSAYAASSYGAGAYTPNTASRMSTNRLNKLGSDLEALAKKLDSYDTSRSK